MVSSMYLGGEEQDRALIVYTEHQKWLIGDYLLINDE